MEGIFTREYRLPEPLMRPLQFLGKCIITLLAIIVGPGVIRMALQAQSRGEFQRLAVAVHAPYLGGPFFVLAICAGLVTVASAVLVWKSRYGTRLFYFGIVLGNLSLPLRLIKNDSSTASIWQIGMLAVICVVLFSGSLTPRPAQLE